MLWTGSLRSVLPTLSSQTILGVHEVCRRVSQMGFITFSLMLPNAAWPIWHLHAQVFLLPNAMSFIYSVSIACTAM